MIRGKLIYCSGMTGMHRDNYKKRVKQSHSPDNFGSSMKATFDFIMLHNLQTSPGKNLMEESSMISRGP